MRSTRTPHRTLGLLALAALPMVSSQSLAAVIINPSYDVSFTSSPNFAALQTTVNNAIAIYSSSLANNLTFQITFKLDNAVGGAQSNYFTSDYPFSSYLTALNSAATSANDSTVLANIGAGPNDPVINGANIAVPQALAVALGLRTPVANYGTVTFNKDTYESNPAGFLGVIQHELNEVLGTSSSLPNGGGAVPTTIAPADLFRYTAAGVRSFDPNGANDPTKKAYFRISPFGPDIQEWNNLASNGGDYGDWATGTFPAAPQDWSGSSAVFTSMSNSTAELVLLDAIGYGLAPVPEPAGVAMAVGVSLMGFAGWRRVRSRSIQA